VTVTMNEIIDNLAQAAAQPEELDVALTPVEQRAILAALKAGQALAAHMRWWLCDEHKTEKLAMGDHCLNQDCQYARTALAAYPGGES
jgi:hypothetical protein